MAADGEQSGGGRRPACGLGDLFASCDDFRSFTAGKGLSFLSSLLGSGLVYEVTRHLLLRGGRKHSFPDKSVPEHNLGTREAGRS